MQTDRGIITTLEVIPHWGMHVVKPEAMPNVRVELAEPYELLVFSLPNGDSIVYVLPESTKADVIRDLTGGVQVASVKEVADELQRRERRNGRVTT